MKKRILIKIQQLIYQYKTPIIFSGGSIANAFAILIAGFVIAKYISPNELGVWASINLIVTYTALFQAGLINGLNLELPYAYGKGDDVQAQLMAGTAQTVTIISSGLVLFFGIAYFLFVPNEDAKIKYGILAVTFIIILSHYQNYLTSTFRSRNSFLKLSYIQIVAAFVNLISLLLVFYFSYYGLIIKAVLVILIYVSFLHYFRPIKVGIIWNKAALFRIFKVGLPIFGLSYIESIASTTDRLLLVKYSELTNVGLYAFAFYGIGIFSIFSASISGYIYPRMTYRFGQNHDMAILWQYAKKITILLFLVQFVMAIIGCMLIPVIITTYFPKYILSTMPMQILLFAGVFRGSNVGVNALWSMKKWKYMISYQLLFSLFLVLFPYLGFHIFSNKLEGISYGVLFACILNLISGFSLTYVATHNWRIS